MCRQCFLRNQTVCSTKANKIARSTPGSGDPTLFFMSSRQQNLLTLWQVLLILSVVRLYPSSAVEHPFVWHL